PAPGRDDLLVAGPGTAGADRGGSGGGLGGGIRYLLPQPTPGQPPGRLDLTAEPGDQWARCAGATLGRGGSPVCRYRTAAAAPLGRVPGGAADDRILAGPAQPVA